MFEAKIVKSKGFEVNPTYYCLLINRGLYITPLGLSDEPYFYYAIERLNDDLRAYYNYVRNRKTVGFDTISVGSMFVYNGCLCQKIDEDRAQQLTDSDGILHGFEIDNYNYWDEVQLPKDTITIKGQKADY